MNTNHGKPAKFWRRCGITLIVLLLTIAAIKTGISQPKYASAQFSSPLPTPIPTSECIAAAIDSIARQYNLPAKVLVAGTEIGSANGLYFSNNAEEWLEFPASGQRACVTTVYDTLHEKPYQVTLNQAMQPIDLDDLKAAESAANTQKCGKFDAVLCQRWNEIDDGKELEIAIWLSDIDHSTIYDEVAVHYSSGLQPIKGDRFDITHPDYERAFAEWEKLLVETYKVHQKPILDFLLDQKVASFSSSVNAPIVFAQVTKSLVTDLAKREDVVGIYLLEGEFKDAMDSATATQRVSRFWQAGNTGNSIRVAMVEDDPVDFGNIYLDHANGGTGPASLSAYGDDMEHPTETAGVIAMRDHPQYQGMAPNVTLYSADAGSYTPQANIITATNWAVNDQNVDVLNLSFGLPVVTHEFWARYFDYTVWVLRRTAVAATQNNNSSVTSPSSGYNVLSVGAFNDNNDANWSNDSMYVNSNFGGVGTRQKPEVVAVGENICTASTNPAPANCDVGNIGTSFAAPQVSGLAALVMNQLGIKRMPELIKAIIMASAVHNIEGERKVSQRDGVGGIDAGLAYAVTQRGRYAIVGGIPNGGWYDYQTLTSGSFDGLNAYHYSIPTIRGERVRVVLAYNSHPDSTDPYNNDTLRSNLDLYAYRPNSGSVVTSSLSTVDNFEILEFVADTTGNYDIQVYKSSWSAGIEYIGIAWTKQATYLPDIPRTDATWQSKIYVRNEDPTAQLSQVTYCRHVGNGNSVSCDNGPNPTINTNHLYSTIPAVNSSMDSVIVDGSESLASLARIFKNNEAKTWLDNGFRAAAADPAFEQITQTLYIPAFYKNSFGTNTTVYIQNMGVTPATFTANFYGRTGYVDRLSIQPGGTIPAQGVWYAVGGNITDTTTWVGSLRITATQPILAQAYQTTSGYAASFNAAAVGSTVIPVVAAYKKAFSLSTGLIIQNLGTTQTNVKLTYCPPQPANPNICPNHTPINNLQPNRAVGFALESATLPAGIVDGWQGSIKVESTTNQPLAVAVNIIKRNAANAVTGGYNYNATAYAGRLVVLPYAARQDGVKYTGYRLHNPNGNTITVTARYYRSDGIPSWSRSIVLQPSWTVGFSQGVTANPADDWHNGIDNGWEGSIVLSADTGPLLVVMREDQPDAANRDVLAGYGGIVLSQ